MFWGYFVWVGICLVSRLFVVLDLLVSGFSGGFASGALGWFDVG